MIALAHVKTECNYGEGGASRFGSRLSRFIPMNRDISGDARRVGTGAVRKPYLPGDESVYLFLEFTIIGQFKIDYTLKIKEGHNYCADIIQSGFQSQIQQIM